MLHITGQKGATLLDRIPELRLIRLGAQAGLVGADHIVPGGAKRAGQRVRYVFVNVELRFRQGAPAVASI